MKSWVPLLLSVFFGSIALASTVPDQYISDRCEEYNDGLDCCVGLVAPTPCPTSADCPTVTTPEPTTESCPTPEPTTACPTFAPPAPCPTLAASVCDTCNSLTEDCVWNELGDVMECVCKPGHITTVEGDCEYWEIIWDFYVVAPGQDFFELRETDGIIDNYTVNFRSIYFTTFDQELNADFVPFQSVAPFLANYDDFSQKWQFLDAVPFGGPSTEDVLTDLTIAELAPLGYEYGDPGEFEYYVDYYLDFATLDASAIKQIKDVLFDGGKFFLTFGSTVNSTDILTYEQIQDIGCCGPRSMYYSPQERTNYANSECFHDAQCDLGFSTCGGFDPVFPDTPGACVCTHGALVDGACPPPVTCPIGACASTREIVDIGEGVYQIQCNPNDINVTIEDVTGGSAFTAADHDFNSIDLKYTYSTKVTKLVVLTFSATTYAEADPVIADFLANWTVTADTFLYNNVEMALNPYPLTISLELGRVSKPSLGVVHFKYVITLGTSLMSTSQKAELAKRIFDDGGSPLFADITVYTGAVDNRYVTSGCDSTRPQIRDSDVDCYFLTETECVGGCDYSTVNSITCTPP